jgi:hypothetical protein
MKGNRMQKFYTKCIDFLSSKINSITIKNNIVELNGKQYYIRASNIFKNNCPYFMIDESEKDSYYGFIFIKYCGKNNIQIWGVKDSKDIYNKHNGFYKVYKDELINFDTFLQHESLNKTELDKLSSKLNIQNPNCIELEILKDKEVLARAVEVNDGWKIKSGSRALTTVVPSLRKNIRELRFQLEGSGVVKYNSQQQTLDFSKDYTFNTLSEAACFILAREVNGRDAFKIKGTNQSYNKFINQK